MPSKPFPWGRNTFPLAGVNIPGVVIGAGTFTTDGSGNVSSASGLFPGMAVSGTNLASGVYTCYFGDGPVTNETSGKSTDINKTAGCGELVTRQAFKQVLYLTGEVCQSGQLAQLPGSWVVQRLSGDGVAASGQLQFMQSTVTTPIASGVYVSTAYVPATPSNALVQVFYALELFSAPTS